MENMDKITEEMMEHICNNLCINRQNAKSQEELEGICSKCKMGNYLTRIYIEHEKYSGIVLCQECEYCKEDTDCQGTEFAWCRNENGLDGNLKITEGCSRGGEKTKKKMPTVSD